MKKTLLIALGLGLGIAGFVYVMIGETGPIGWLNAAQLWAFGSYSRKMSLLAMIVIGVFLWVPIGLVIASFDDGRDRPAAHPSPPAKEHSTAWWGAVGFVVMMALVWAAAYGYVWWDLRQRSVDSLATYEPVELTGGMQSPGGGREHLALRGRVLGDHVVSRGSSNSTEVWQTLVPVVERGWREGDPVHFVIRLDKYGQGALREAARGSLPLLVRADGSVPTPALQVFDKMKSPIAADAVAVVLVATERGLPAPVVQELDWSTAMVWAVVGSFCATLFLIAMLASPWLQARQARRDLKRQQRLARKGAR